MLNSDVLLLIEIREFKYNGGVWREILKTLLKFRIVWAIDSHLKIVKDREVRDVDYPFIPFLIILISSSFSSLSSVRLEQDNQSCITLLTKGRSTAETNRFIEIRKFWISDYIRIGAVEIVYVPTEEMTSDYYTIPLQGATFEKMVKKILG